MDAATVAVQHSVARTDQNIPMPNGIAGNIDFRQRVGWGSVDQLPLMTENSFDANELFNRSF